MSKKEAQKWAHHFVESMARTARVEIDKKTVKPAFSNCVGENAEVAKDGRFNLDYYARAPISVDDQATAVRRVHDELKKRGYKILGLQEIGGEKSSVILDAKSKEKDFSISVEGSSQDPDLLFSVTTPCILPPGAKQQKF
ncbi:MAG: hypothetical protein ACRDP3_28270 [Streptomyces sp.]|uniref:hypothetical protein n=1 Tax=Streptomyces sp. TaxID=1931 RepID=UPI003D6BFCFB